MECAAEWVNVHEIVSNTRFSRDGLQKKLPDMVERNLLAVKDAEKTYYYQAVFDPSVLGL